MNGLIRNRVALFADTVSSPNMIAATRRLVEEGYELVVVGAGAHAAVITLAHAGVPARAVLGSPEQALAELNPAVAVSQEQDATLGASVPNRVILGSSTPASSVSTVACFNSWVENYLAPRVPRLQFKKARP